MNPLIKTTFYLHIVLLLLDRNKEVSAEEQMTIVEDVIGTYELQSIKSQISNSTSKLAESLNVLGKNISNAARNSIGQEKIEKKIVKLQETVTNLNQSISNTQSYLEKMYTDLKDRFQSFGTRITQTLSNLKLFVEHQSSQFQNVLGKASSASRQILAGDCLDLYNLRYNASGTYWLNKFGLRVLCDMETEGGGWLVIQRRAKVDVQVDFSRDWFGYKIGFGNLDTEFWIGNDVLHMLTNQKPYELRIEMEDYENGTFFATYSNFRVGNEESSYALDVGNFSGNASDAFKYHHGQPFTTKDRDQDNYEDGNCATHFSGGWWYDRCYDTHLNGIYPDPPDRKNGSYISWWSRKKNQETIPLVLTNVMIKIRPKMMS